MSNQRAGKFKPAVMRDGSLNDMKLRAFFRTAADLVEDNSDAQFYFEQFVDHISNGGSLSSDDPVVVRRILGL
tara:strand:+ start:297 stop:515 length:219 start_codon:yes stop_codon:yes gene_type:complete